MLQPDLVALLYRADWTRWSLRGDLITSADPAVAMRLAEAAAASMRTRSAGTWPPPGFAIHRTGHHPGDRLRQRVAHLAVAPGGRYRYQPGEPERPDPAGDDEDAISLVVADGRHCYVVRGGEADRFEPGRTPMDWLIYPARRLSLFELNATGLATHIDARPARRLEHLEPADRPPGRPDPRR